jgi:hypothetical protein
VEYAAPVAVFLFFLGVMALQARRRGNPYGGAAAPTPEQKRLARAFQIPMIAGWALTLVAVIGGDDFLTLLIPAGMLILAGGAAFQFDYRGIREAVTRMDARSVSARFFGVRTVTPLWGVLAMLIGVGFLAGGIAAAVT